MRAALVNMGSSCGAFHREPPPVIAQRRCELIHGIIQLFISWMDGWVDGWSVMSYLPRSFDDNVFHMYFGLYSRILVGFLKVDLGRSSLSNYICGLYFFSSSKFRWKLRRKSRLKFSTCSAVLHLQSTCSPCLVGIAAVFLVSDLIIFALQANKDLMATQTKPNKYIHILLFSHFSHFHKTKK